MPADRAHLLVSTPLTEALERLEAEAANLDGWNQPGGVAIRRCVTAVRDAMAEAMEVGLGTQEMAVASGWSENTLKAWAKRIEAGEAVGHPWDRMVVYRDARGAYLFRASTVPLKGMSAA
jgi:hypothetical protein